MDKTIAWCILFPQNMILNRAIRTLTISYENRPAEILPIRRKTIYNQSIIRKSSNLTFVFKRILLSLGLLSTNFKCVRDEFFIKKFTASIKKMEK